MAELWERRRKRNQRALARTGILCKNLTVSTDRGRPVTFAATKLTGSSVRTMLHPDVFAESGLNPDDPGTVLLHHMDPATPLSETDEVLVPASGDPVSDRYIVAHTFRGEGPDSAGKTKEIFLAAICHKYR